MSAKLFWTPQSKRDLADIFDWIAMDRPRAAERVYLAITARALLLANNPHLGKPRPEIGPNIRALTETPYLILHRVAPAPSTPPRVEILRVLHGNRFLPGLFRP